MKQIFSRILLLVVVIAAILGLSSCKIFVEQEPSTYDLVVNKFERSVVYGSELNLSGLDIEVTTGGEVKHVEVTKDMVTGGTTTEVGEQELVIEYQGMTWTLYYEVFYKIDHIVDGFIYDSQLVTEREEYMPVKNPEKEGSIFLGWSAQIPETLTGNLRIEAIFADGLTLPEFSATYGDTLGDLTLPETKDGHWEWKQGPETSVGNAGTNKFAVVFVPNNPAAKAFEVLVDVTVAKKKLTFTIINDVYDWDGSLHRVEYQLSDGVDPSDVKIICFGTEYATEPGEYSYDIQIRDTNYEGQIKGIFKINKVKLTVDVLLQDGDTYSDNATITYGDSFPGHKVVIKDKNGNDYTLNRALEVSINKPSMLIAGYYDIVATIKDITDDGNDDLRYYDITYNIAKLVVEGLDFDPGPPLLKENYDIYYGDLLSSIEFADHPNGVWVWDYTYNEFAAQDFVGNAGKNTFRAEFIPKDSSYNKSEAYIVLDVNKRVLRIDVDPESTTVVYDGQEHGLSYVIVDPSTGRVFDNLIVNGDVKYVAAYGNGYNITLSIDDANYTGSVSTALKINKADPETDFSKVITLTWRANLKLSDIALDAGYEWKYKNTTIDVAGEYIFDVIFTPEDTDNYNIINGQISVVVEKAQSSITGLAEKYDSWTYNGSEFEINREAFGYESVGGTVVYLYNGEPAIALTNAGEYLITLVIEENDTHLGCEVSTIVVIKKANPQISMLNINGWTYGDEANAPSAKTTFGEIVYRYYTKEVDQYVLYGADGLTAPTEAGTYYVHASVAAADNWNDAESIYKEFKIEKQTVALPVVDDIVYQGKLVKPTVAESEYYNVAEGGNEGGENVGEYGVSLVLVDPNNYKWEGLSSAVATVKYKITKFNDNVIEDFDGGEWIYEDTVTHSTESIFGEVRYTYYLKKANGDYERVTEAKNAGEYKVEARVAQTDNYNGCSLEKTFVIEKKSVDVPSLAQDQTSFVYTSGVITSGFTAPAGAYYKVSDVGGRDVGDYYVTLTLNAPSNYKWADGEDGSERKLQYSIVKDEVSITALSIDGWKYKGTINAPTVEDDADYTSATIKYQYKTPAGDWVDTTITADSVAGTYRVVATIAGTTNYDGDVETFEFEIEKADNATINGIITGKKYTTVYNKDASYTIPGLSGSHTEKALTYTITKNGASVTEMKNAGTYTVVITLPESDNYEEVSEIVTVEISKKEISKPTLSSGSNIYNGGTFVPTPSSSADYTHAFENASSIAAGTYKVTFTLTDENYVWDSDIVWESGTAGVLTYTIQKANIGIEGNTSNRNNVPYTLAGYILTDIVAKGVNVESTLIPTITLGGEEVDAITGVGVYTVTYNYNDTTGNYNNRKVEFTVNITKATNRFTSNPAGGKSWTYGNVVDTTVFGAKASFGEVKYRFFTDAEGNNPLTVTSETRLGYGTYYVQAYVDDNSDNYDDCQSSIVAFNITKATATISGVISSATSVYGQYATTTKDQLVANSSVTLAYGSAVKPAVTIMFTPVSGGTATPADTIYNAGTYVVTYYYVDDNHNSVTETATVFIDRADTTIDVVESVSKVYDNTEYILPVTVKVNGVDITLGENGLTYVITKNGTPVDEIKNAGTYTITYTYAGDANYKAGTDITTVVVDKANPVITPWTDHKLVYDTTSAIYKATATASGVEIDKDKYISVTYYTKSGDKYTPINAPAGKGTYYYLVTVAEGENWYSGNTGYVEFTIAQGQANITGFATTAHQYNGSVAPIPTAHTNLGNVYYYFKSATKSGAKFERWTATNGPKDADTYIVYAEVINDVNGNYLGDKTAEINYVITPASTIISAGNVGKTYGFSYTTLESLIGATYKNVGNVDATAGLKYEITGGDTDKLKDGKIVNVGSYKVTVTLTDTNYTAALVEITVTVSPKSATITAEDKETYYKGSEYTIDEIKSLISASIDGIVAGDSTELTYTVSGGKTIENQGAYEVIVSYTSDNYTVISVPVTVTVEPATTSIIANNVNKTYGFTYESLESLIGANYKDTSGADATANLKYEITGGDINKLVNGKIVNAGTYTVTVSLTDTNYTAASAEVTVTVAPKGFIGTVKVNATYDDKLSSVELPDVEGGYLEWHNGENKVGNVGNNVWLARFVADDSGNYADVENISVTVVVSTKFITKPEWVANQTFEYDGTTSHSAVITKLDDAAYYDIAGNGNVAANEDGYTVTITLKSAHGDNIKWIGGSDEALSFTYYVTKAPTSITIAGFEQNSNNEYSIDLGKYDSERAYAIPAGTVALKDGTTATAGYTVKYIPNVGDTVEDFKGDIKAAGTYIITYTYAGNANHNASNNATLTVTIGKADSSVVITPVTGDSIDANNKISVGYNDESHLPTVTINGVETNYSSASYTKPEGFVGSVTEIVGETAGTHTLTYVLTNDNNYADITVTVTIVIDQVENSDTITVKSDARFDDKVLSKITLPGNENGAWSLVIVGVTTSTSVDVDTVFGEVTTYTYKATFVSTNVNYADDYEEGTIFVDRKLVPEPTVDDMEYTGELRIPKPKINGPYTVTVNNGGKDHNIDPKAYFVEFTLDNPETHEWSKASDSINDIDGAKIKVYYDITNIVNTWKDGQSLAIEGDKWTYSFGETISVPTAMANEGTTYIQFRVKGTDAWIDWAYYTEGKWIITENAPVNSGTYDIRAIVYADNDKAVDEANNGKGNNYDRLVSATKTLTITQKPTEIILAGVSGRNGVYTYNFGSYTGGIYTIPTGTVALVNGSANAVVTNVKYTDMSNNVVDGFTGNISAAGTYVITYAYTDSENNHADSTATLTVTIGKATLATYSGETEIVRTYGDEGWAAIAESLILSGVNNETREAAKTSDVTITGQGTYEVTYKFAGDNNYEASEDIVITITVQKKSATITAADNAFVYDGTAYDTNDKLHALIGASISGIFEGDSEGLTYTVSEGKTIKDQGTYEVIVSYDNGNYSVASVPVTVTVLKKSVSIEGIASGATVTKVYHGSEGYKLSDIIGAYFVDVNGDKIYTSTVYSQATLVNANEDGYEVTISLDNNNYEAASITVKVVIEKAEATISFGSEVVNSTVTKTYVSGTSYNLASLIGASAIHNGQLVSGENNVNIKYYDENGNEITSLSEAKEAGHIVTVKLVHDNYVAEETVTFIIKKANSSISGVTDGQEIIVDKYDGENHLPENVTINGTTVTPSITYTKPEGFDRDVTNYVEGVTAGTYTLVYSFAGDSNYNPITATVTLIINQVKNEDDVKWESTAEFGDNVLDKFNLPVNANGAWSIEGVDENTTFTTMDKNTFKAIFTSDNVNYADRVIENIEIIVGKRSVSIEGIANDAEITTDKSGNTLVYRGSEGYAIEDIIGAYFVDVNGNKIYTSTVYSQATLVDANENGYTVTITLVHDNYEADSITVTVVIERMALVVPEVTGTYIYTVENGVEKVHDLTYTSAYDVFKDLKLANGTSLVSISGDKNSQAGTNYNVVFTLNDVNNYKWVGVEGATATAPYVIGKAIPTVTIEDVEANSENKITLTSREYGSAGYAALPEVFVNGVLSAVKLSGTITNKGEYTFEYNVEETGNYQSRTVTVTLEITKAENSFASNPAGGKSWTYGNVVDTTVFGAKASFGEVKYRFFTDAEGNNPLTVTSETRLGYGTYYVQAYVDDNSENYDDCESSIVAFNITKGTATISGAISSATSVYGQYAETTKDQLIADASVTLADGSAEKPVVTIMFTPIGGNTATPVDTIYAAGTYEVTYSYEDDNHNKATVEGITIVINKATPTVTIEGVEANSENKITLNSREYGAAGYADLPDVYVNGEKAGELTGTITDAKTYTFTYTAPETDNYSERIVTVTIEITKAENNFTVNPAENKSWSYGNVVDTTEFDAKALFGTEVKYRFFTDAEGKNPITVTSETRLGYGTYYVQAYVDDNSENYDDCESSIVAFNITKGTATISGVISSATSVYGQYAATTKDELIEDASVTLAYGSAVKPEVTIMFKPIGGSKATPVDTIYGAGTYVVTYSYEDGNHNKVTVGNITIAIDKATPVVTIGGVTADSENKVTLASREYGSENYSVLPEVFVNGESVGNLTGEINDATTYSFTYTAQETDNYNERIVTVTLTVTKKSVSIEGIENGATVTTDKSDNTLVYIGEDGYNLSEIIGAYFVGINGDEIKTGILYNGKADLALADANESGYDVTITLVNDNYEATSITVKVVIEKADATITLKDGIVDKTVSVEYTPGGSHNLATLIGASASVGGAIKYYVNGVETESLSEVNVDGYEVTIKLIADNYKAEETVTFKIKKIETSFTVNGNVVVNVGENSEYLYSISRNYGTEGYANLPVVEANGIAITAVPTIKYQKLGTTTWVDGVTAITDAGIYVFTYDHTDETGHYTDETLVVTLTINKVDSSVVITPATDDSIGDGSDGSKTITTDYNGKNHLPTVKINGEKVEPSVEYVAAAGYTGIDADGINSGVYTLTYEFAGDTNHNSVEVTVTLTITRLTSNNVEILHSNENNTDDKWIYGETPDYYVSGATIKYYQGTYDEESKKVVYSDDEYEMPEDGFMVPGYYKAVAAIAATVNYPAGDAEQEFTVDKKEVALVNNTLASVTTTYGEYAEVSYSTVMGVKLQLIGTQIAPDITFTYNGKAHDGSIYNAGTYVITYSLPDKYADNYKMTPVVVTITINQATPTIDHKFGDAYYFENQIAYKDISNYTVTGVNGETVTGSVTVVGILNFNGGSGTVEVDFTSTNPNYASVDNVPVTGIKLYTVAKINNDNNRAYGSIERALKAAGDNEIVWVMPLSEVGGNPIIIVGGINDNGEFDPSIPVNISGKVTLVLPYKLENGSLDYNKKSSSSTASQYGTPSLENKHLAEEDVATNRTTLVQVNENVVINVNGTLTVAGQISSGQSGHIYTGHTGGFYAELKLLDGATINCGGIIESYGYITEQNNGKSIINITNGGLLRQPFVILDYRGGSYLSNVGSNMLNIGLSPICEFEMRNVQAKIVMYFGSSMDVSANFNASNMDAGMDITLIGSSGSPFLRMTEKSRVEINYYGSNTFDSAGNMIEEKMEIHMHGGGYINRLLLEKVIDLWLTKFDYTVDTNNGFLPFSHLMDITLHNGEYKSDTQERFHLMWGSKLTLDNASLEIGELFIADSSLQYDIEADAANYYPCKDKDATLTLKNGSTLIVNKIGGKVYSDSTANKIVVKEATSSTVKGIKNAGATAYKDPMSYVESHTDTLKLINTDGSIASTPIIGMPMFFNGSVWTHGVRVNVDTDNNGVSDYHVIVPILSDATTFTVDLDDPLNSDPDLKFKGWFVDAACTLPFDGSVPEGYEMTLYAKWVSTKGWSIVWEDKTSTWGTLDGTTNNYGEINSSDKVQFYIDGETSTVLPTLTGKWESDTSKQYYFSHWAWNNGSKWITIDSIDDIDFDENDYTKSYTITAVWIAKYKVYATTMENAKVDISDGKTKTITSTSDVLWYKSGTELTITASMVGDVNTWEKQTIAGSNKTSWKGAITSNIELNFKAYKKSSETCLAAGTLITLADGTKKAVEDLRQGDMVMAFDHLTGVITTSKVIIVVRTASDFYKNTFVFDDGTRLATINEHGIYDLDLNKYVNISHENYHEFLGHRFVSVDVNGNLGVKTLIDVECVYETGYKYDIVSEQTLNYVAEDTLSVTHVLVDIINTFEFNENMIYDQEKMMADIEKYGLYTYDEWEEHCDISVFDEYNIPIMKIGVEKGLYTEEYIIYLINRFVLNDDAQIK